MLDTALPVVIGLLAYVAVGFGPGLLLIRGRNRWALATCIAGPLGLVLTALVGTLLVRLDMPVAVWARPWLLLMAFVGVATALWSRGTPDPELLEPPTPLDRREGALTLALLVAVTLLAAALLIAPAAIGGVQYTAFRYNRWDALNYQSMARYLAWHPLSWINTAGDQSLMDRDAFYIWTRHWLAQRYTTSLLMAWVARINGRPIAAVEYTGSLIYLVLAVGPALALAGLARLPMLIRAAFALAISAGFWGMAVTDMRAESQVNSIPIVLLIAFAAARLAEAAGTGRAGPNGAAPCRRSATILALGVASLVPVYAETLPMVLAGLVAFAALRWWQRRGQRAPTGWLASAAAAGLVLGCAAWPSVLGFYKIQERQATGHRIPWERFFGWLWTIPWRDLPVGAWGLSSFVSPGGGGGGGAEAGRWLTAAIWLLAVALSLMFLWTLARTLWRREDRAALAAAQAMALAALAQFVVFWARDERWAAGKGMLFGYAFIVAAVVLGLARATGASPAPGSGAGNRIGAHGKRWLRRAIPGIVVAWLLVEGVVVPLQRVYAIRHGREPNNYLGTDLYMGKYDYDLRPFQRALDGEPDAPLGVAIDSVWLTHYFGLGLGENRRVLDWLGVRDRDADRWKRAVLGRPPVVPASRFLLVQKSPAMMRALRSAQVVAENKDFALFRSESGQWGSGQTIIAWSRAVQANAKGNTRVLLDHDLLEIDVLNLDPAPVTLTLAARVVPAMDLDPQSDITVLLETDQPQAVMMAGPLRNWEVNVPVRVEPGVQTIMLTLQSGGPSAAAWLYDFRLLPAQAAGAQTRPGQ